VIEQRSLLKLRVLDIRMNREKTSRHLQQVVNVARLIRAAIHTLGQLIRWSKVFILAVTTGRVTVIVDDCVPEKLGRYAIVFVTTVVILLQHAEHLRYLRVSVLTFQLICQAFEWIQQGLLTEMMRETQPIVVTRVSVKIREPFVHAAELSVEHLL